ncbi:MAG: ribosome biogenesis GTP-binding protein YihA/YsxC [Clostridia bacterium]
MNLHNAVFVTSVYDINKLPTKDIPQVVFAGRSNVGKSSMINKILNRKNLARASSSPGKTAAINYYEIDEKVFLVDLPGYGYAKVSGTEKERWGRLLDDFFNEYKRIDIVFSLVDIRHSPTEYDALMQHLAKKLNLPFAVILTKKDKILKSKFDERVKAIKDELFLAEDIPVIAFSAQTGEGTAEILEIIERIVEKDETNKILSEQ